ncbi:MAG: TadE family protein [Acidobacteriota bacterium]
MRLRRHSRKSRSGQALVESALILLLFITTMIGILDVSQLLFIHQSLVERVRGALRWGIVQPWDGSGSQIQNMVLYRTSTVSQGNGVPTPPGFLGLERENIQVTRTLGTADNPNDERLTITIVNYNFNFFTPGVAKVFQNNTAVMESAPMAYK